MRPKSIILDLFSPRGRHPMSVPAILEACALFGITANAARVALVRLCAGGRLDRVGPGAYALSQGAETFNRHVREWARQDSLMRPWTGPWIMVHLETPPQAGNRRPIARALAMARFAPATPTLAVRPDNLRTNTDELAAALVDFGLGEPFFISVGEPASQLTIERWMRELWPVQKLLESYEHMSSRLERSLAGLASTRFERALAETFTLGGEAIRTMVLDPLLPEEIMPGARRARLFEILRKYDHAGRAIWRRFNARFEQAARVDFAPFQSGASAGGGIL